MSDGPPADTTPTLFHVETQEVFYVTNEVNTADKETALLLVEGKKLGKETGRKLISRLVTNVHPIVDGCCSASEES